MRSLLPACAAARGAGMTRMALAAGMLLLSACAPGPKEGPSTSAPSGSASGDPEGAPAPGAAPTTSGAAPPSPGALSTPPGPEGGIRPLPETPHARYGEGRQTLAMELDAGIAAWRASDPAAALPPFFRLLHWTGLPAPVAEKVRFGFEAASAAALAPTEEARSRWVETARLFFVEPDQPRLSEAVIALLPQVRDEAQRRLLKRLPGLLLESGSDRASPAGAAGTGAAAPNPSPSPAPPSPEALEEAEAVLAQKVDSLLRQGRPLPAVHVLMAFSSPGRADYREKTRRKAGGLFCEEKRRQGSRAYRAGLEAGSPAAKKVAFLSARSALDSCARFFPDLPAGKKAAENRSQVDAELSKLEALPSEPKP